MNRYVADTHALFWYLTASPRLGSQAKQAFEEGVRGQAVIYIPAIVLAELYFLNEKVGRPLDFPSEYDRLRQSDSLCSLLLYLKMYWTLMWMQQCRRCTTGSSLVWPGDWARSVYLWIRTLWIAAWHRSCGSSVFGV
jgi:hypothetical protein